MYLIISHPAQAFPSYFEHTALIHNGFRQPQPRKAAARKLEPGKINTRKTSRTSATGKTPVVFPQEDIPLGEARCTGRVEKAHPQHRRGRRGKLDHRLESAPLLQLRI